MKSEAGFTLVELLAALAAGGLLLAIVGTMTGMFGDDVRKTRAPTSFEQVASIQPLLETLLSRATPPSGGRERFDGDDRHLAAEVPPPAVLGPVGELRLTLDVVRERDGAALDMGLEQIDAAFEADPRLPVRRRLARGFRSIEFDYRRDADARLPTLIRIAFASRERDPWTIAIATRLNAASGCRFDPISLTCR